MDISTVSVALGMMEVKGLVKQAGEMNYIRLRESESKYQVM